MEVLQIPAELEQALALRDELQPQRILEIGCWDGGTLREWLAGDPPPRLVVAVSLEHRQPDVYPSWVQNGTEFVVGTGDSAGGEMVALIRKHAPYDWAFIDGDHSYEGAKHDFDTVRPLMSPGGVILLHDITSGIEVHGPEQLFDELKAQGYRTDAFQVGERQRWSAGIGVVYV